ncbi:MAG: carbamoyltransferase HypF [Lachnospiraceae bacterium]|nr:carbamoyltransferase HypF [Lachnospiraceae bacterium]
MAKAGYTIEISGVVQGVGFRPYIRREVSGRALCGWVRNTTNGAKLVLEGEEEEILGFLRELKEGKPGAALIEQTKAVRDEVLQGYTDFSILPSEAQEQKTALIPPDLCTCEDCLRELFDKTNRRYRYPFLNCTNCGPRFTIVKDVPYDRVRTTMADFVMCTDCAAEYGDIGNRRYHAEPTCCAACGPRLSFVRDGRVQEGDAIAQARKLLSEGGILAVKGLGGFHLACMAEDTEAVLRLRERKQRPHKPLALMCADTAQAARLCSISAEEEAFLTSPARPVVLLAKKERDARRHISENSRIGIMLPYTPLHFLLLTDGFGPLVMTSANRSSEPMIYQNEEAFAELGDVADAFLVHDREIHVPCDDSVLFGTDGGTFVRRSRGYVPVPFFMKEALPQILAVGAELKATFALSKGSRIFAGPHIGDLKSPASYRNDIRQIAHMERLFGIRPETLVCDLHPDLLSTRYAEERAKKEALPLIRVQHHHAHLASCMADNGLTGDVIGVIWDGTGYGTDATIWGGEFLTGNAASCTRAGHVRRFPLPGGDLAVEEIRRIAIALLRESFPEDTEEELLSRANIFPEGGLQSAALRQHGRRCLRQLGHDVNCPRTSSIGRLFDGVSALLGICTRVTYEGRAAVLLETAAESAPGAGESGEAAAAFPYELMIKDGCRVFDYRPMIRQMMKEAERGADRAVLAARFMNTLVAMSARMCGEISEETGLGRIVLSGGCFLNRYLTKRMKQTLTEAGFDVYTHKRVSPGDEGLSLGQLMVAAAQTETNGA